MHLRLNAIALAAMSALLAGCANPVLKVRGAGFSAEDSPSLAHEPQTMAESMQKVNHLRAQYYEAIRQQREASMAATTGLTWLGTALVGLAYGKAANGWIVGTALVGGTTYGLTRAQLDARQVELWQQGIESLDCARRASLPLDIGVDQQSAISASLVQLVAARDQVQIEATSVGAEVDRIGRANVPSADLVDQSVQGATTAIADADTAAASARALLNAARGRELSTAVDRVGAQVVRATDDIAVDVSSVKPLVSGIGGFSAIFVPGIDSTIGQAMAKWTSTTTAMAAQAARDGKAAQTVDTSALSNALQRLSAAMKVLSARQATIKALVASVDTAAISEALKSCNVAGVSTALVLQPATLAFSEKKADGKGVSISGGTAPYEVSLLDPVADGTVTTLFSGGMSDRLQVKVSATTPAGTYTVSVKDNSTSHRVVTLAVHVTAAPSSSPSPPASPSASPALTPSPAVKTVVVGVKKAPDGTTATRGATASPAPAPATPISPALQALWTKLGESLRATQPIALAGGASVSVTDTKLNGSSMQVTLSCTKPVDPGKATQIAIKTALSQVDTATYSQLQQAGAIDTSATQLKLYPTKTCVK